MRFLQQRTAPVVGAKFWAKVWGPASCRPHRHLQVGREGRKSPTKVSPLFVPSPALSSELFLATFCKAIVKPVLVYDVGDSIEAAHTQTRRDLNETASLDVDTLGDVLV